MIDGHSDLFGISKGHCAQLRRISTTKRAMFEAHKFAAPFPVFLQGCVVHGRGQGKVVLSCPTANISSVGHEDVVARLGYGVFFGYASLVGQEGVFQMVCSVGNNATFGNGPVTIEAHILHEFPANFYDSTLSLLFYGNLRNQTTFHSLARSPKRDKMVTHLKKTRKTRGSTQVGYGRVGKHRKHAGGRGNAGGLTHHRTLLDRYHPGYFGKVGMRHFHVLRNTEYRPIVNIDKLWNLVSEQKKTRIPEGKMPVIDCTRAGYFKVLGKGLLPEIPVCVRARFFSKVAEEKITAAGGKCEIVNRKPEAPKPKKEKSA
ncbi:putative 60S ribosomal protein L27a [Paratrimastix pyriformis]|uniref:Large ribosomal subunit protein uL15 n=1 Tax=Paratrimastix pyriformis TaxID=342808 RepID=A0ABQ8UV06_9EUKA|nr:putative 60S ribosomal protein L27a [Paratrimastix pyriformis]